MEREIYVRGSGVPRIAIVGGLHGDEPIGKKIIERFKKIPITRGTLGLIVAHPLAAKRKKRFLKEDLNRAFPGRHKGTIEQRIAYEVLTFVKKFDLVIDLHATNSNIDSLAIVTRLTSKTKKYFLLCQCARLRS